MPNEEPKPVFNHCENLTRNERVSQPTLHFFPPELLSEIFLQVIPPRSFESAEHDPKSIFTLSQVCSYWRSVTLSTPTLWTSIPFIYDKPRRDCRTDNFLALVQTFIERSGDATIHITIWICNSPSEDKTIPHPAIDLIISHSHRWKTAIIHLGRYLFPLLESEEKCLLPILDGLNLRCRNCYVHGTTKNIFTNAPALRHAIIDRCRSDRSLNLPWTQLTSYVGLPKAMQTLRPASAHLTTLVLCGPLKRMAYPSSALQFPQLTSLRVEETNAYPYNYAGPFFQYIAAPNMLSLEIIDRPFSRAPQIVKHLISTTLSQFSPLKSLVFHVAGLTLGLVEKLLDMAPSLISLDVDNMSPAGFQSLVFKATFTPHGLRPSSTATGVSDNSGTIRYGCWASC